MGWWCQGISADWPLLACQTPMGARGVSKGRRTQNRQNQAAAGSQSLVPFCASCAGSILGRFTGPGRFVTSRRDAFALESGVVHPRPSAPIRIVPRDLSTDGDSSAGLIEWQLLGWPRGAGESNECVRQNMRLTGGQCLQGDKTRASRAIGGGRRRPCRPHRQFATTDRRHTKTWLGLSVPV